MGFTYNSSTPTAVTYDGSTVNKITYNGTTVWEATIEKSGTYRSQANVSFTLKPYGLLKVWINDISTADDYNPTISLNNIKFAHFVCYNTNWPGLQMFNSSGHYDYGYWDSDRSGIFIKWTPTRVYGAWLCADVDNLSSLVSPPRGYYDLGAWTAGAAPTLKIWSTNSSYYSPHYNIKLKSSDSAVESL